MALLLFFGGLVALAGFAAWRDADLRLVAGALAVGFVGSNIVWLTMSVAQRPGPFTAFEMLVMIAAFIAWDLRRMRLGAQRADAALIALIAVSVLSVCANVALALAGSRPAWAQIHLHELLTNCAFALECLLVTATGVADGVRTGRFRGWAGAGRRAAQSDRRANRGGEAE